MKVALIDPSLFTGPYDLGLREGLRQAGDDARLFTKRLTREDPIGPDADVIQHFYRILPEALLALPRPIVRGMKGVSYIADLRRLIVALERWRPDIIHFQWVPLPVMDALFLPKLRQLAPLILTVHDSNPYMGSPGTRIMRIGAFDILKRFDRLIVHTDEARARVAAQGVPDEKIAKIPHGILHAESAGAAVRAAERADGAIDILMFGKLRPYKGLDVLIRAIAQLTPAQRTKCRVHVVGKPYMDVRPLAALMAELGVESSFTLDLRFIADEEIGPIFNRADVAVFPYREIDASGVLMAAIASGCAIVASRVGSFAEMLEDEREALLVPPGDEAALARALGRIIDDPVLRRRLAEGARAVERAVPSWPEIGRTTHALYEAAIRTPQPA